MRFCLIGCGDIAARMHAPSYLRYREKHPDFQLTACCDRQPERAAAMQARLGFARYYTDYKEMLAREKPDAVAVTVSETASVNVGVDVLRAGIPMLIEKPPGRTGSDTARLAAEAEKMNVPCQVAFNRRYMPVLVGMRERAPEKIQLVTYDMIRCGRREPQFSNTAVHAIDAVRYLANGDYRAVRFSYQELPEFGEGVCNIWMDCRMTNGVQAQIRICPMSGASLERAAIHAEDRLILGFTPAWGSRDAPGRIEDFAKNNAPVITAFAPSEVYEHNGFWAENEAFFDALVAGRMPSPDPRATMNTMLVKECIDQRKTEILL